jgi:hypothetical protein
MVACPFGSAIALVLASWEAIDKNRNRFTRNPRLPVNRGFSVCWTKTDNERQNMNKNQTRVATRFAPETRFELQAGPPLPFRATQENEFERLKSRLLTTQLAGLAKPELNTPLRRAANEAAALAWVTYYPLLVFPVLFEEKAATAVHRTERQARIYAASRELLGV